MTSAHTVLPTGTRGTAPHRSASTSTSSHVVPGLLQSEEYARAVLSVGLSLTSEEQLEERVAARLGRQTRLASPDRPELWVVLDEAVLRRPIGGLPVMRRQLTHLLEAAGERRVQVLPFDQGEHDAMGGSLTVLTLPDDTEASYVEGAHHGRFFEDPAEVRNHRLTYDRLRAAALPPLMSLDMIRSVLRSRYCPPPPLELSSPGRPATAANAPSAPRTRAAAATAHRATTWRRRAERGACEDFPRGRLVVHRSTQHPQGGGTWSTSSTPAVRRSTLRSHAAARPPTRCAATGSDSPGHEG